MGRLSGPRWLHLRRPRSAYQNVAAFFTGAEGWGLLSQQRTDTRQTNRIEARWGRLRIAEFVTDLPPGPRWRLDRVTLDGRPLVATHGAGARAVAVLKEPAVLDTSGILEFAWIQDG
jgi:hypothetical protein